MNQNGLKPIAVFEALKGVIALLASLGLHELAGDNVAQVIDVLVTHLHLNPASEIPSVFIHAASEVTDSRIVLISLGALLYSIIRFVEAYGLWHSLRWTEWFALVSGGIYLPFEAYEIVVNSNVLSVALFAINFIIVSYVYITLKKQHALR
ncbi:DUF2127 domain-containing protein [Zhongshania sp. BJYM1]|uniref:DUF2127 domain-containing protein n=1 Tax=Zhongshania aquatica TaxID=2965069 RepID=UPI0022B36139|nr:DUF2127 domain-containing protein [Marortus sp. BJYM1]